MMKIWDILGIEKTTDKKAIKKAYHEKLRVTNPEDNQEAFMKLREAYEKAMAEEEPLETNIENAFFHAKSDYILDKLGSGEKDDKEIISLQAMRKRNEELDQWWKRVCKVYKDVKTRWDSQAWYMLLYEDIPYQMDYYKKCRGRLYDFFFASYCSSDTGNLPEEVWRLIDGFFSYSETDAKRVMSEDVKLQEINRKVKLNELFDFTKFDMERNMENADDFCNDYAAFIDWLPETAKDQWHSRDGKEELEEEFQKLKAYGVFYLPFVCMDLAYHFSDFQGKETEKRIKELEECFGNIAEIRLLKAEYALYQNNKERAAQLLHILYREVSPKNFVMIYQMAECCERAGLWYEAWMLYKMLTRLNPKPFMFQREKEIYDTQKQYFEDGANPLLQNTAREKLHICKLYLEYGDKWKAAKIWEQISSLGIDDWEYHIVLCKYALAMDDMEQANQEFRILNEYKDQIGSAIEQLEYRELKGELLFETKKYKETVDYSNELLEEYPSSYPVLLLRSYADWNHSYTQKRYRDLNTLISLNPDDKRARLLSAYLLFTINHYEHAMEVLRPVEESCYPQMEIIRLEMIYNRDSYEEYEQRVLAFWEKSMEEEFPIEAKSKHAMFDLKSAFFNIITVISRKEEKEEVKEILDFCERLKHSPYNHPEKYMDWGSIYANAEMHDQAIIFYEKKLEKETDAEKRKKLQRQVFVVCYYAKYYNKAYEILPYIVNEKSAEDIQALFGAVYEWAGMQEEAEQCFQRGIEYKGDYKSYQRLVEYYYRRGQWKKAVDVEDKCLVVAGKSGNVYTQAFNFYIDIGEYDKALECAHLMNQYGLDYHKRQYHLCLGNVYMGKEEFEKALYHYQESEKEHCPVNTWSSRGICNVALGRYDEAIRFYEKCAYRKEKISILYLCLMQHCYFFRKGKVDHALTEQIQEETEKQLHTKPDWIRESYCYMGEVMAEKGLFEQAASYFLQADKEKLCPGCGHCHEVLWGMAWLSIYQSKYQEAITYFKQAREKDKETAMYVEYLQIKNLQNASL